MSSITAAAGSVRRCILLFRPTDLRIHDNLALKRALELGVPLLPVFCFDPRYVGEKRTKFGNMRMSPKKSRFLIECVRDLRENLKEKGLPLFISVEKPELTIEQLCKPTCSVAHTIVVASKEPCSEETRVDEKVQHALHHGLNGSLETIWQKTLYHPEDLPLKASAKNMPLKFTPWRQMVENANTPVRTPWEMGTGAPKTWPNEWLVSTDHPGLTFFPTMSDLGHGDGCDSAEDAGCMEDDAEGRFRGGETVALQRLRSWMWDQDCLAKYFETRNGMLGNSYSSKFSPWLATGCLSPRLIHAECKAYERARVKNKSTYWLVFELLWRDFFQFQAVKQGNHIFMEAGPLGRTDPHYSREWPGDAKALDRWKTGTTGWPLVDANMRELNATGFMSNRGRQNVASFLVLEQRVDWREGADYFEMHLLDHDVASNYGNWCAAAGLFGGRVNRFNILKQSNDYDRAGEYVKRWIPELQHVPVNKVHAPWKMSHDEMRKSHCQIGVDYPSPLPSICAWNDEQKGGAAGGRKQKKKKPSSGSREFHTTTGGKNAARSKKFEAPKGGGYTSHLRYY